MKKLTRIEYLRKFPINNSINEKSKHFYALERAWKNRDFEIDKYWSRATYFWAFIASAFAGYLALISSDNFEKIQKSFPQLEYVIICIGFVFSVAWVLVNIGSKKWQENWEKHIDMLEDKVTGPLYKTVLEKRSFSVSKVNLYCSVFMVLIWLSLAIRYLHDNICWTCDMKLSNFDLVITCSSASVLYILIMWVIVFARTKNKDSEMKFSLRTIKYKT